MGKRNRGRRKGGHNKGYSHRTGRGWYVYEGKTAVPLRDEHGKHIKERDREQEAKDAYARYVIQRGGPKKDGSGIRVREGCKLYMGSVKNPKTFRMRGKFLFDFCSGFPARFWNPKGKPDHPEPTEADHIHLGLGERDMADVKIEDVEKWIEAHSGWEDHRNPLQAVRRAFNYCVKIGRLAASPLHGLQVPAGKARMTYLTEETEAAIYRLANPALAEFVRVCIRTGCRPDIELASVEARHVEETPDGQRWCFPKEEAKGGKKPRTIYVAPEIAEIVRDKIKAYPEGRLFRNTRGEPWTYDAIKTAFQRLRDTLKEAKVKFEKPLVAYTPRHTFAKRMLGGFWGERVTLEILAGLMGNSAAVCAKHYAQWSEQYTSPFWRAVSGPNSRNHETGHGRGEGGERQGRRE